jgi:hypothetical protein
MMKGFSLSAAATLGALAACALLSACSSPMPQQGDSVADATYVPIGSNIPRKKSSGPAGNGGAVDMQSLENARNNGNGVMNGPGTK